MTKSQVKYVSLMLLTLNCLVLSTKCTILNEKTVGLEQIKQWIVLKICVFLSVKSKQLTTKMLLCWKELGKLNIIIDILTQICLQLKTWLDDQRSGQIFHMHIFERMKVWNLRNWPPKPNFGWEICKPAWQLVFLKYEI